MSKTQIKDFTKGSISKELILFALPLFGSNILQIVYNMVDMIVVGRVLGKVGLSAVSVGGDISHYLTFVSIGFARASQVMIARLIGGGHRDKIGTFVGTMSSFLLVCALFFSTLGLAFQGPILRLMNTPAEALAGAVSYSAICMGGLAFTYGYNAVSSILRGMGDSRHPFIFIGISSVLNLILDFVFVVYLDMGAGGAALATVASQAVSFICCVAFLAKNREEFELNITFRDFLHWDISLLREYVRLGIPMALRSASVQTSKLFINSFINSYGVAVSAFSGIAHKLAKIANIISNSMNTAGSTMIGQNIAAGEFQRVKKILAAIIRITLVIAITLSAAIWLFPDQIFGLFVDPGEEEVLALARGYIPIASIMFFASALRAAMNALINGSGNHRINLVTALLDGIFMRIGLSALFGLWLGFGYYGFWFGNAVAGLTPFFIGLVFFLSGRWKKGKTKKA